MKDLSVAEVWQRAGRSGFRRARKTDVVLLRLLLEVGLCFMTGGLHAVDK
jgi:hypothetical protein